MRRRPPRVFPVLDGPPADGKEGRRSSLSQIEFGPAQPDAFSEGHWVQVKLGQIKFSRVKSKRTDCAGISPATGLSVKWV